jgi:hypothetical protein
MMGRNTSGEEVAVSWLTGSVEEHTLLWLLLSSVIGGIVGTGVTFVFEDVLRPWLTFQRDTSRLIRTYTTPLLRSAERLETRINILLRNAERGWYADDEYFRLSTLFIFGEHLGWIRNIEREFGFVPMESSKRDRAFNSGLNGIFRALSSFSYFRWHPDPVAVSASEVPRLMGSAMGEAMTPGAQTTRVLDFTEFVDAYGRGPEFQRWFRDLDAVLRRATPADDLVWDRLICAAANLRALCAFLDPKGRMVHPRPLANLDLLVHDEVRAQLAKSFPDLQPTEAVTA